MTAPLPSRDHDAPLRSAIAALFPARDVWRDASGWHGKRRGGLVPGDGTDPGSYYLRADSAPLLVLLLAEADSPGSEDALDETMEPFLAACAPGGIRDPAGLAAALEAAAQPP